MGLSRRGFLKRLAVLSGGAIAATHLPAAAEQQVIEHATQSVSPANVRSPAGLTDLTAGEKLSPGDVVYVGRGGKVYRANTSSTERLGIALNFAGANEPVS